MKYSKDMYIYSGFFGGYEAMKCNTENLVKCRKERTCDACNKTINIGDYALHESGFLYGEPVSTYACLECVEEWLEESGQIDNEEDENETKERKG